MFDLLRENNYQPSSETYALLLKSLSHLAPASYALDVAIQLVKEMNMSKYPVVPKPCMYCFFFFFKKKIVLKKVIYLFLQICCLTQFSFFFNTHLYIYIYKQPLLIISSI